MQTWLAAVAITLTPVCQEARIRTSHDYKIHLEVTMKLRQLTSSGQDKEVSLSDELLYHGNDHGNNQLMIMHTVQNLRINSFISAEYQILFIPLLCPTVLYNLKVIF